MAGHVSTPIRLTFHSAIYQPCLSVRNSLGPYRVVILPGKWSLPKAFSRIQNAIVDSLWIDTGASDGRSSVRGSVKMWPMEWESREIDCTRDTNCGIETARATSLFLDSVDGSGSYRSRFHRRIEDLVLSNRRNSESTLSSADIMVLRLRIVTSMSPRR
jgi:hypothetical protein